MKIVALSDTHWKLTELNVPACDLFLFCGDWSVSDGGIKDLLTFGNFLKTVKAKHKVVIAGNHDFIAQTNTSMTQAVMQEAKATYLQDAGITIDGLNIWGTPWSVEFCNWAFMCSDEELAMKWRKIPSNTDILLTHTPPYGILDVVPNNGSVGSRTLVERIKKVKPNLHLFGHIHEGYGHVYSDNTEYYNVSVVDADYELVNKPVVIDL